MKIFLKKINKKLFILLFSCLFIIPQIVFSLEINYPRIPGATAPQDIPEGTPSETVLSLYIAYIFNLIVWVSGIILLGSIVYAGFLYLTSAGKPEKIIAAKDQIVNSFIGVLIIFSSFLILQILNPTLIDLEMPDSEAIRVVEKPQTPKPPKIERFSSNDAEIPFGQVIEKRVFGKELMTNIKNNATTTDKIAKTLEDQVDDLVKEVKKCNCGQAKPKCKGTINIGGYGSQQECNTQEGKGCNVYCTDSCSSDVCARQRDDIEDLEKKNLQELDKLKEEQIKTIQNIRLFQEEIFKLEMTEELMKSCPLYALQSLANFFSKENWYKNEQGSLRKILSWDDITTIDPKEKRYDWATFYCPVGGTEREIIFSPLMLIPETPEQEVKPEGSPDEILSLACKVEVPVGEIIDRSKRTANLLLFKLETLLFLQGRMIEAIDQLHVLISQCSSQQPMCCSFCIEVKIKKIKICIRQCVGQACPFSEIKKKQEEIEELQKQINNIVYGKGNKEQIGIVPIIDQVIAGILADLNKVIRKEMSMCVSDIKEEKLGLLSDCSTSIGGIEPNKLCCDEEIKDFQECLEECYLELEHKKYKTCLNKCLLKKPEPQKWCNHYMNFYCCHPEKTKN